MGHLLFVRRLDRPTAPLLIKPGLEALVQLRQAGLTRASQQPHRMVVVDAEAGERQGSHQQQRQQGHAGVGAEQEQAGGENGEDREGGVENRDRSQMAGNRHPAEAAGVDQRG